MNKNKHTLVHTPLVTLGYSLFALLAASLVVSTVLPFGRMLSHPGVRTENVIIILISLIIGAVLPALAGYFIGSSAVRSKSKLSHHFNGVLFGLAAYWIAYALGFASLPYELFGTQHSWLVINALLPSIIGGIVLIVIGVLHARGKQAARDLVEYKPYVTILLVLLAVSSLGALVLNVVSDRGRVIDAVLPIGLIVALIITYVTLRKARLAKAARIGWAAVGVSTLAITYTVVYQFVISLDIFIFNPNPTFGAFPYAAVAGLVIAVAAWIFYWAIQVRFLNKAAEKPAKKAASKAVKKLVKRATK